MEKKKREWKRAAGAIFLGILFFFVGVMNLGPAWEEYTADSSQGWIFGVFLVSVVLGAIYLCRGILLLRGSNNKRKEEETE